MKAFADRPIDWKDISGVIVRQGESALDWRYISQHLKPLCEAKEQPDILDRLEALRREVRLRSENKTLATAESANRRP